MDENHNGLDVCRAPGRPGERFCPRDGRVAGADQRVLRRAKAPRAAVKRARSAATHRWAAVPSRARRTSSATIRPTPVPTLPPTRREIPRRSAWEARSSRPPTASLAPTSPTAAAISLVPIKPSRILSAAETWKPQPRPAGAGTNGMNGGMGGGMNSGMNGMGGQGQGQGNLGGADNTQPTPAVRISMKLGFVPLAASQPAATSLAVAGHLSAMPALHLQVPVQVVMQGRTAILRGVVATEHDRDLAERVVRLEGAVDKVQNQLVVAGAAVLRQASPTPAERIVAAAETAVRLTSALMVRPLVMPHCSPRHCPSQPRPPRGHLGRCRHPRRPRRTDRRGRCCQLDRLCWSSGFSWQMPPKGGTPRAGHKC